MDFTHNGYDVRIVQNAADTIIRFETCDTRKVYEATFFDRDFPEYASLGGLEFATKMLTNALQGVANVAIRCSISHGDLTVEVEYTTPLFPKPVLLTFVLHSVRRTSATEDVVSLGRRIKELESQLTEMVALQKRLAVMEASNLCWTSAKEDVMSLGRRLEMVSQKQEKRIADLELKVFHHR